MVLGLLFHFLPLEPLRDGLRRVPPGGIGAREAALVGLLTHFGAAPSLVLAARLAWEGVIISGGAVAGLVSFLLRWTATPSPAEPFR